MAQVHMTEAEVSSDFAAVLRKIGDGEEVVVDRNGKPLAIIKPAEQDPLALSDLIALAAQR
jgi:antitoxin (DNA-binding transcriptional repressor) of toxin-antitoxin stability system